MKMSKSGTRHILLGALFAVFALSLAAVCLLQAKTFAAFAQDEPGTAEKTVEVSMTLNDDLVVNFYVPEDAGASAVVGFNGEEETLQGTLTDGQYKFSFDGVTPQYMTKEITFTAGAYALGKPLSVQSYCEGLLSSTAEDLGIGSLEYAVLRELVVDILNYGAAAQSYTDTDTEGLANATLTEEQQGYATEFDLTATEPELGNGGAVKWYSAGMVCGSKPSLYVRIVLPEGKTAEAYTVEVDGKTAVYKRTEGQIATYYYEELNVLEFAKDMQIVVKEGETPVSGTLTYSVHDYISAMADSQNEGTAALVKALYGYGKAASAYANVGKFDAYTIDADSGTVSRAYADENYSWAYPVATAGEGEALTLTGGNVTLSVTGTGAATVGTMMIEATDSFTFEAGILNSGHIDTTAPENTIGAGATLNVTTDGTTNGFNAESVCLTVNGALKAVCTDPEGAEGDPSGVTARDITVNAGASFEIEGYPLGVYMNENGTFTVSGTASFADGARYGLRTDNGLALIVNEGGSFTVADAAEGAISFEDGGEVTVNGGSVSASAGVQIGTLRMRGGSFDLTGNRSTYNIVNFELVDGAFSAANTLCTDKLVVKGGTLNINVEKIFGDATNPAGIQPYSTTEGQRYYFLGGTTTLNREPQDGEIGAAGIFTWAKGNNIAVAIAGYASVQVTGTFDYAVYLGGIASGELYEFTKSPDCAGSCIPDTSGVSSDGYGLSHDVAIKHYSRPGFDFWGTISSATYWAEANVCTIGNTNELQNQDLSGKFLGDVDFAKL